MFQAGQRANVDPRQLSFTYARNIVIDGYPKALAAPSPGLCGTAAVANGNPTPLLQYRM